MRAFRYLLSTVLVLATCLLLILPCLTPGVAGYFVFLTLVAVPLWVADVLMLAYYVWRGSLWWVCFAMVLCFGVPHIGRYVPLRALFGGSRTEVPTLSVVSWNVDNFRLSRDVLRGSSQAIAALDPDIILLQERPHDNLIAWDTIRAAFPDYPHAVINTREDEVLNLAVLSKYPLSGRKEFYFKDSYNKILQVDAIIDTVRVRLFNVHLQTTGIAPATPRGSLADKFRHNAMRRNRQAVLLAEEIEASPSPVLVCGDFNDIPSSYAYSTVAHSLRDCYTDAGDGWGGSYQPAGGLFRIDYTFCTHDWKPLYYGLLPTGWSDHKIQYARLRLRTEE